MRPTEPEELILQESPESKVLFLTASEGDDAHGAPTDRPVARCGTPPRKS